MHDKLKIAFVAWAAARNVLSPERCCQLMNREGFQSVANKLSEEFGQSSEAAAYAEGLPVARLAAEFVALPAWVAGWLQCEASRVYEGKA